VTEGWADSAPVGFVFVPWGGDPQPCVWCAHPTGGDRQHVRLVVLAGPSVLGQLPNAAPVCPRCVAGGGSTGRAYVRARLGLESIARALDTVSPDHAAQLADLVTTAVGGIHRVGGLHRVVTETIEAL
jgi:hypothetical protein